MAPPLLTVVCPAFNEAGTIHGSIQTLASYLDSLGTDYEIVVVSDGSTDATRQEATRDQGPHVRVIEYERNMGKGYALRTGSRAARGEWIAWFDADLDIRPEALGRFLEVARRDGLDIVIGSKRHPESEVDYPRKRRCYSWLYQQLIRALFQLSVRDTQVGIKLFRREALAAVLPVVLVKRYAFDLEVLAVAQRFGFRNIREQPVELLYRFTGTSIDWRAIMNALVDTLAIFYRLRILRFYDRKRQLTERISKYADRPAPSLVAAIVVGAGGQTSAAGLAGEVEQLRATLPGSIPVITLEKPRTEVPPDRGWLRAALESSTEDAIAFIDCGMRISHGWADAALNVLRDPTVGVVVGPTVPRLSGALQHDAGAILSESRFGVGGARVRHHVGTLQEVGDFPASNLVVLREELAAVVSSGIYSEDQLCAAVRARGKRTVLCSPEVNASSPSKPLFRPYLSSLWKTGTARGRQFGKLRQPRLRHIIPVLLVLSFAAALPAVLVGGVARLIAESVLISYGLAVIGFTIVIAALHRRIRLALLTSAGAVLSHLTFGAALLVGLSGRVVRRQRPDRRGPDERA